MPGARRQAAISQPDTRRGESKIHRRKEREKNVGEEKQAKF